MGLPTTHRFLSCWQAGPSIVSAILTMSPLNLVISTAALWPCESDKITTLTFKVTVTLPAPHLHHVHLLHHLSRVLQGPEAPNFHLLPSVCHGRGSVPDTLSRFGLLWLLRQEQTLCSPGYYQTLHPPASVFQSDEVIDKNESPNLLSNFQNVFLPRKLFIPQIACRIFLSLLCLEFSWYICLRISSYSCLISFSPPPDCKSLKGTHLFARGDRAGSA